MEKYYDHLKWDSDFFGFKVAKITRDDISDRYLALTIQELRSKKFRLVYWFVPGEQVGSVSTAHDHGGLLVDEKVTYLKDIANVTLVPLRSSYVTTPYADAEPDSAMIRLAQQSGKYSRFRLDPSFPATFCDKLYTCWIKRSVHKEIANQVLVVKKAKNILGFIALGIKNNCGNIGLLSVADHSIRKGIGRLLLTDAERYFMKNKCIMAQVVTQHRNINACRLYEACGYQVEKIENIFHFWL